MSATSVQDGQECVLVLAPSGRDVDVVSRVLADAGINVRPAHDIEAFCAGIVEGSGAGVLTEEALTPGAAQGLLRALAAQPEWSDYPLVLLTHKDGAPAGWERIRRLDPLGNVSLLERPVRTQTLVSAVFVALRSRRRQYELRDELERSEQAELGLTQLTERLEQRVRDRTSQLQLLRDVATAANTAETVEEAFAFALRRAGQHNGWWYGHAYVPQGGSEAKLVPLRAHYEALPGRFHRMHLALAARPLLRGQGLVSEVYEHGLPRWTRDVAQELHARGLEDVDRLDLASLLAFPVMVGERAMAVLEFFAGTPVEPDAGLLDLLASIGTQLGRVIERERAAQSLGESHRLIQSISDMSPTMIGIFDLTEDRFVYVNRRVLDFFGIGAADATAPGWRHLQDAVHPDDRQRLREIVGVQFRHLSGDKPISWQVRLRDRWGAYRWIRNWNLVFRRDETGRPTQVLGVSVDTTEQMAVEARLRQAERLSAVGTLAAGIAHEVNNPLASIMMTAQLLRRRKPAPDVDAMLADLIADSKRCARIVRSVQQFARRQPAPRAPQDANALVRAAQELSSAELQNAGVALRLDLAESLPALNVDATEIEQVVVNLVMNAVHASSSGQSVVVRTRRADGAVCIEVEDCGHGMAPEVRQRIFDPFFTTRGREGGTGLGLSIAHGIVEGYGGRIDVESEVGRGTIVRVFLPIEGAES